MLGRTELAERLARMIWAATPSAMRPGGQAYVLRLDPSPMLDEYRSGDREQPEHLHNLTCNIFNKEHPGWVLRCANFDASSFTLCVTRFS